MPIFNLSNYDLNEPWKLNSLSAEPSHSARIMALLMYCYITIKELVTNIKYNFKFDLKKDKWIWIGLYLDYGYNGECNGYFVYNYNFIKVLRFKKIIPFIITAIIFYFYIRFQRD